MTRINLIPPVKLSNKHLLAEYRELPRVFGLAHRAYKRGEHPNDPRNPTEYCLGPGHARFFYSRLLFLYLRFRAISIEMSRRGWNPAHTDVPLETYLDMPVEWQNDYEPSPKEILTNLARLRERDPEFYRAHSI